MKELGVIPEHRVSIDAYTCDVCGRRATTTDTFEYQEFTTIGVHGGYGSVFGDGVELECDICQRCLKEKLGEYFRPPDKVHKGTTVYLQQDYCED
jgi:antitoxin CcdA